MVAVRDRAVGRPPSAARRRPRASSLTSALAGADCVQVSLKASLLLDPASSPDRDSIHSRFGDGPDGRRQIGSTPAERRRQHRAPAGCCSHRFLAGRMRPSTRSSERSTRGSPIGERKRVDRRGGLLLLVQTCAFADRARHDRIDGRALVCRLTGWQLRRRHCDSAARAVRRMNAIVWNGDRGRVSLGDSASVGAPLSRGAGSQSGRAAGGRSCRGSSRPGVHPRRACCRLQG